MKSHIQYISGINLFQMNSKIFQEFNPPNRRVLVRPKKSGLDLFFNQLFYNGPIAFLDPNKIDPIFKIAHVNPGSAVIFENKGA